MMLAIVPVILWAKHGTVISGADVFKAAIRPVLSIVIGVVATLPASLPGRIQSALPRLVVETGILFSVHLLVLLFVMKQKAVYVGLLRDTRLWPFHKRPAEATSTLA
jgi:hypothetical protein